VAVESNSIGDNFFKKNANIFSNCCVSLYIFLPSITKILRKVSLKAQKTELVENAKAVSKKLTI
jgi:hypothetical protein